jgi:MraZ protein
MASDSQSQTFYAGEFRHSLDDKNRITIPSRWRRADGEDFIILPEAQETFLLVMSHGAFSRMSAEAESNPLVAPRERRVFLRHLHARAEHASSDKQGRLVLPDDICKLLDLKGEVTLVGGRGRFEIWNSNKWKQAHREEKTTYQRVADVIGL